MDEELLPKGSDDEVPKEVNEVRMEALDFKKMSLQEDEGAAGGSDIKEETPEALAAEVKKKRKKSRNKNARSQDLRRRNRIKKSVNKTLEGKGYEVLVLRKKDKQPENKE